MKKLPIGARLTLWYLLIFAIAQALFGAGMWFVLRHNLYSMTDQSLRDQVDDLTHFLEVQKKNATIAKLQEEVSEAYLIEHSGNYLQLYVDSGEWIYKSDFLQHHALTPRKSSNQIYYQDLSFGGKPFRFIAQQITVNGRTYMAQTGLPMDEVARTLALFRRCLLMFSPVLFLAAAVGGYWLSRQALAPVDAITRSAQLIGGGNLRSRLEVPATGDELERLSGTLNQMLERIESAFFRVTQFTADASHELRTPLALIHTEAELALRRSRSAVEYKDALRHILLEAQRTASLIEQLLSLARADAGRETLDFRPVNLNEVVADVASGWRQIAAIRHVRFTQTIGHCDAIVRGDEGMLRRLVTILLDNAFKFVGESGAVEIWTEQCQERFIIAVRDNGPGIAKEDQEKIFERFYRIDKARSRDLGGAGLGLSIAQWVVGQHHGLISVESVPGEGSTFRVELPLSPVGEQNRMEIKRA